METPSEKIQRLAEEAKQRLELHKKQMEEKNKQMEEKRKKREEETAKAKAETIIKQQQAIQEKQKRDLESSEHMKKIQEDAKKRLENDKRDREERDKKREEETEKAKIEAAKNQQQAQQNMGFDQNEYMKNMSKAWESAGIDMNALMQQSMAQMGNMEETMKQMLGASAGNLMNTDDAIAHFTDGMSDLMNPDTTLSQYEQWATAFNSNLAYANGYYANDLTVGYPIEALTGGLENAWGIQNKKELLDKLNWLSVEGGHTKYAHDLWAILINNPKPKWRPEIESLRLNYMSRDIDVTLQALMEYGDNLMNGYTMLRQSTIIKNECTPNILAWDLQRAIFLTRSGFDMEWLTKEEALEYIVKFAELARKTYSSWEEYSYSFLMGFYMWSGDPDRLEQRVDGHNDLLSNEKSPWKILSWDTPNTVG